jgi:hypothetical protein
MDVHVSTMTGKLDGFRAINSNTRTNPFCLAMYRERGRQRYLSHLAIPMKC